MPISPSLRATVAARSRGEVGLAHLRARLALLAMAIVPVLLSTALVYAVISSQGLDARSNVAADSATVSAALASQLDRTEGMLRVLAADPPFARAVTGGAGAGAAMDRARESLRALAAVAGALVRDAELVDATGRIRLRLADGTVTAPTGAGARVDPSTLKTVLAAPPGGVTRLPADRTSRAEMRMTIGVRLADLSNADRRDSGLLLFDLSVPELLSEVGVRLHEQGGYAVLVDGTDARVVADSRDISAGGVVGQGTRLGPAQLETLLPDLLHHTGGAAERLLADGWAVATTDVRSGPGPGWTVVVLHPTVPPSFPMAILALLVALSIVAVGLAVWMARQVLRPGVRRAPAAIPAAGAAGAPATAAVAPVVDLTQRDVLTELGNHRAFQEELGRQVEWYERHAVPFALLLIDIDDLGRLNDADGHASGDSLLRAMGEHIRDVLRYADRAFRVGGDEFAILMPHTDAAGARTLGQRLLKAIAAPSEVVGSAASPSPMPPISFSGGISACPDLATARQEIYAQAEAALARCKRRGRGSIDVFDPKRDARTVAADPRELIAQVTQVAVQRQLRAVFQPIVDLNTGGIIGFEGLVRTTPEAPFSNPGELFDAAEAVGQTVLLDAACFDVVATAAAAIAPNHAVSINLSPRTVEAPDFSPTAILASLARYGLDPKRVIIELTEREQLEDIPRLRQNLAGLQRAGIRIAADDVGAGNAGLRLLSQLRFDIVKIDLSLVQEGAARDTSRAVLRSLRDLAGRWGAFVIAEGIETAEQLRAVREMGLSAGQGYLLGRPGPSVELEPLDLEALEQGHLLLQNNPVAPTLMPRPDVSVAST